jgi:uncharacterized protein YjiS (DUF1127 family)
MEDGMRFLSRLGRGWQDRRTRARTRRELNELSEHLLKDIGLPRGVIDSLYR